MRWLAHNQVLKVWKMPKFRVNRPGNRRIEGYRQYERRELGSKMNGKPCFLSFSDWLLSVKPPKRVA
jgi:hypothetical protein